MPQRVNLGPSPVEEGQMKRIKVGKRDLLIARLGGSFKAMNDWCNHAGCLLSGGRIEGNMVVCPCHEVGFDLDTGKNMTSPGICDDQPVYATERVGADLVVVGFPDD